MTRKYDSDVNDERTIKRNICNKQTYADIVLWDDVFEWLENVVKIADSTRSFLKVNW